MTIDVAELRRFAEEAGWPSVSPSEFVELLDAYEERDRLRDEIERAAQLAVEAKNTILKLRGALDLAQTETERDRLRVALDELKARIQSVCEAGHVDFPGLEILGEALGESDTALEGRE